MHNVWCNRASTLEPLRAPFRARLLTKICSVGCAVIRPPHVVQLPARGAYQKWPGRRHQEHGWVGELEVVRNVAGENDSRSMTQRRQKYDQC